MHRRKFTDRFLKLAGVAQEYSWAGHLCLSRNDVSVAKQIDSGVWSACVQNGLGTARGTLTGIAAAENAFEAPSGIANHFNGEPEPTKMPLAIAQKLVGNAVIRIKERRARNE